MSKFYAQLTLLFTLAALIGFGCSESDREKTAPPPADSTATAASSDSVVITIVAGDTTDAFSLLEQTHTVQSKSTAMGVFVQAIDSVAGGGRAYWLFSVNDSLPMVAADKFEVVPGDTVRWHLRFSNL